MTGAIRHWTRGLLNRRAVALRRLSFSPNVETHRRRARFDHRRPERLGPGVPRFLAGIQRRRHKSNLSQCTGRLGLEENCPHGGIGSLSAEAIPFLDRTATGAQMENPSGAGAVSPGRRSRRDRPDHGLASNRPRAVSTGIRSRPANRRFRLVRRASVGDARSVPAIWGLERARSIVFAAQVFECLLEHGRRRKACLRVFLNGFDKDLA